MGGLSIWHWIVLLVFIVLPAVVLFAIISAVRRNSRDRAAAAAAARTPEARLGQLDALRAKGAISDAELERQRAAILRDI